MKLNSENHVITEQLIFLIESSQKTDTSVKT